jgi:hypothetical protein
LWFWQAIKGFDKPEICQVSQLAFDKEVIPVVTHFKMCTLLFLLGAANRLSEISAKGESIKIVEKFI